jgi:hypothetical protein
MAAVSGDRLTRDSPGGGADSKRRQFLADPSTNHVEPDDEVNEEAEEGSSHDAEEPA